MYYKEKVKVPIHKVVIGCTYHLVGDLQNGSFVTHEEVTRKITRITDEHVICECGRKFIINNNLQITERL